MLRKSMTYKGFVLLEGLIALTMLTMIIGVFLSSHQLFLTKDRAQKEQLLMYRVLYEEIRHYQNQPVEGTRSIWREGNHYTVTIIQDQGKVTKVYISNGKEELAIETT